jgi:hypothetical protein
MTSASGKRRWREPWRFKEHTLRPAASLDFRVSVSGRSWLQSMPTPPPSPNASGQPDLMAGGWIYAALIAGAAWVVALLLAIGVS